MHFSFLWLSTLPALEKWPQCALALTSIKPDNLYWACDLSRAWFYFAGTYTQCPIAPSPPRAQLGSRPRKLGCAGCRWRKRWWGKGPALMWSPRFPPAAADSAHKEQRRLMHPGHNYVWITQRYTGWRDEMGSNLLQTNRLQNPAELHLCSSKHSRVDLKSFTAQWAAESRK